MIGFYNYSVIVTYIGVALSVSGMALASTGQFKFAILCLASIRNALQCLRSE